MPNPPVGRQDEGVQCCRIGTSSSLLCLRDILLVDLCIYTSVPKLVLFLKPALGSLISLIWTALPPPLISSRNNNHLAFTDHFRAHHTVKIVLTL